MPKKDTASAVAGMLSSAGALARPVPTETPIPAAPVESPRPTTAESAITHAPEEVRPSAAVSTLPPAAPSRDATDKAPRTLRLQPGTALALREAWLEAKRDDVLLTAQDFASALVDEALARRRLTRAALSR